MSCEFTLANDFDAVVGDNKEFFEGEVHTSLADKMNVSEDRIINLACHPGESLTES